MEVDHTIADFYEVFLGEDKLWHVRTKSSNGQIIMSSEGYAERTYAVQVGADTGLPSMEDFYSKGD